MNEDEEVDEETKEYVVSWECLITAHSPKEAVRLARADIADGIANFDVDDGDTIWTIDATDGMVLAVDPMKGTP
jgi:hypothetical protein